MQKWQKDFLELLNTLVDEVENFFVDMSEMIDTFLEFEWEFGEPIETTEASEIIDLHVVDMELESFLAEFNDDYSEVDGLLLDDFDPAFPFSVDATLENHPACIGCRHYHGYAYGGNLLVCGMHPEGWHDGNCPDWEVENVFEQT